LNCLRLISGAGGCRRFGQQRFDHRFPSSFVFRSDDLLPTTYLIDRQGRIRQKIIGAKDKAGWEAVIKPLLAETPATASAAN